MLSLLTGGLTGASSSLLITDGLGSSTPVIRFVANLACLRLSGLSPAVMNLALAGVANLVLSPADPAAMMLVGLLDDSAVQGLNLATLTLSPVVPATLTLGPVSVGDLALTNRASSC